MSVEQYKKGYRKLMERRAKKGFTVHAIVYAAVNSGLVALNLVVTPQVPWFVCPLVGWGAGLAANYYFGVRKYPEHIEQEEREIEREAEKLAQGN